jgi:hypothetical protein
MTEREIQIQLARYIDSRRHPFQMVNGFVYKWESDYWTLDTKGMTREYEIKVSRQDYMKDAAKIKHLDMPGGSGPNYFYYVCPEGLIQPEEVSKSYGLIYSIRNSYLHLVKRPTKLHPNQFADYKMLAEKYHWKWFNLWRQKYIDKEITFDEYKAGFNLELEQDFQSLNT